MVETSMGGAVTRRRHVFLSVVTYFGTVEPETGEAINRACEQMKAAGIEHTVQMWSGDSLIADARNGVLAEFLKSGADDLVFIDYDVAWDGDEFMRLLNHPVDLVAGVYRIKKPDEEFPVRFLERGGRWDDPETGLLEVSGVPFGFVRMTRNCALRMTIWYADRVYAHARTGKAWCVFDCGLADGLYWGEDFFFCRRWIDTEGKVWVDAEMTLHHVGWKDHAKPNEGRMKYTGCLGDYLRRMAGEGRAVA